MTPSDASRKLIVTADDLGRSSAINRGIALAHRNGIVTAASLMVHGTAVNEAIALTRALPQLAIGIHIEITDWDCRGGRWVERSRRADPTDERQVRAAIATQLALFTELLGRPPTHLDSHQHVHREEPIRSALHDLATVLGVNLRGATTLGTPRYCGAFYGQYGAGLPFHQAITVDALVELITTLPAGVTELGCHPGTWPDPLADSYGQERLLEMETLCDARVRRACAIAGIELVSPASTHPLSVIRRHTLLDYAALPSSEPAGSFQDEA